MLVKTTYDHYQNVSMGCKNRAKTLLADPHSAPISVEELAQNINDYFWYRRQVSEGTKVPIVYEFTRR